MNDRLYRSRDDRMLAGVAGGLAELWDADPSLIRLAWALLVILTGGIALLVYIVMAIVVPEDPNGLASTVAPGVDSTQPGTDWHAQRATSRAAAREARRAARQGRRSSGRRTGSLIVGGALVVFGTWFLLREYVPAFDADLFWPIALVGLGIVILAMAIRPRADDVETGVGDGGSASSAVANTAPGPATADRS